MNLWARWLLPLQLAALLVSGLSLQIDSIPSIKAAASNVAWNMLHGWYLGNQTGNVPGNLIAPYYWWEAGAMFGHLVDYWYYTGDPTYVQEVTQAIVWQAGDNGFMPQNQTKDEGNDDQVFWAFAALDAAELLFPHPPSSAPSWIAMAQAVFNLQTTRWENNVCGGGLRWQIYSYNQGYDYKNVAANGGFFQLAARLARYTNNATYLHWAEKEWDWWVKTPMFNSTTFQINDGTEIATGCSVPNTQQFSYNYGIMIAGLAYMYNHTENDKWLPPLQGIINRTLIEFFPNGEKIISEIICEPYGICKEDALTFKSFTIRWLAVTAQLVPSLASTIWPYVQASAVGAAGQCDGEYDGMYEICGTLWNTTTWDGSYGPGQQMSALAVIGANMINLKNLPPPLTLKTGGTSKSDPSAGTSDGSSGPGAVYTQPITTGDKAGAGILTALMLIIILGGAYWLVF